MKFIPEGEEDAATVMMENGKWIKIWKTQGKLNWSLRDVSGRLPTKIYAKIVDEILNSNFECINWSTAKFETPYIQFKQQPHEVTDEKVRPCQVKLLAKFWQFPILAFSFKESTHTIGIDTNSMSIMYYNMQPLDLDQEFEKIVTLGSIETCPTDIFSMAKRVEGLKLFDPSKCILKLFLSEFFFGMFSNSQIIPKDFVKKFFKMDRKGNFKEEDFEHKEIMEFIDQCQCQTSKVKRVFEFNFSHQEGSKMKEKIEEINDNIQFQKRRTKSLNQSFIEKLI